MECAFDRAPLHPKKGATTKNALIKSDLSKVPKSVFKPKTRRGDGKSYVEIHYNLVVKIQSGPMEFALEIGGKKYGSCAAKY